MPDTAFPTEINMKLGSISTVSNYPCLEKTLYKQPNLCTNDLCHKYIPNFIQYKPECVHNDVTVLK